MKLAISDKKILTFYIKGGQTFIVGGDDGGYDQWSMLMFMNRGMWVKQTFLLKQKMLCLIHGYLRIMFSSENIKQT